MNLLYFYTRFFQALDACSNLFKYKCGWHQVAIPNTMDVLFQILPRKVNKLNNSAFNFKLGFGNKLSRIHCHIIFNICTHFEVLWLALLRLESNNIGNCILIWLNLCIYYNKMRNWNCFLLCVILKETKNL